MTKWYCIRECGWRGCVVYTDGFTPDTCLYDKKTCPKWIEDEREETPLKDAPPGAFWHLHEANLLEMAGDLKALKERVDALEERQRVAKYDRKRILERVEALENQPYAAAIDHLNLRAQVKKLEGFRNAAGIALKQDDEKIKTLEHQMRDHYHCRHGGTAYLNRVGWGDVNKEYPE